MNSLNRDIHRLKEYITQVRDIKKYLVREGDFERAAEAAALEQDFSETLHILNTRDEGQFHETKR